MVSDQLASFIHALERDFKLEINVQHQSPATVVLLPAGYDVGLVYYRTLSFSVEHQQMLLGRSKVVHIDEDLWVHKPSIILDRVASLLGKAQRIYARDTMLRRIHKADALAFQEKYHLQVALPGKYRYALFYRETLVSIAVFSGGRKMNEQAADYRSFELLRFCHSGNYLVVGGLSKLIKGFVRDFLPGDVMTYVDRDWSDGENYKKLGFQEIGKLMPQVFYIEQVLGERRTHRPEVPHYTVKNLGSIKMRVSFKS